MFRRGDPFSYQSTLLSLKSVKIALNLNFFRDAVKIGRGSTDQIPGNVVFQNFYFPGQRFRPEIDSEKFRLAPENILQSISVTTKPADLSEAKGYSQQIKQSDYLNSNECIWICHYLPID